MPLDLAPAAAFVRDHRIPERLQQVLTAESSLTDGIVAPVFLLCLAAATAAGNEAQADAAMDAGPALVVAVLIGAVAARVLHRALVLTVARMLPVAVSMIGTDLPGRDRLFLGWVGPRTALAFGLLAYIDLTGPDRATAPPHGHVRPTDTPFRDVPSMP